MKLKKFEAATEKEAVDKVKKQLGADALIMNIKKVQGRGVFGFLKKPMVQVTAAYDIVASEKISYKNPAIEAIMAEAKEETEAVGQEIKEAKEAPKGANKSKGKGKDTKLDDEMSENKKALEKVLTDKKIADQQEKIKNLESSLSAMAKKLQASEYLTDASRVYDNSILQIFYEALSAQGVLDSIAREILDGVQNSYGNEILDISFVAGKVYARIIEILGYSSPVTAQPDKTKFVFFMGPTGVGKTTTIAKLASKLVLEQNVKVGLITADTYRIAAVEQLKVYAEILSLDIEVAYSVEDFKNSVKIMEASKNVVFIDTAGRSHKNSENLTELKGLINSASESEKFLVLSATTKYEDLISIAGTFEDISDFRMILTKFDETMRFGSILNICYTTKRQISYITTGQNVPDDIEQMKPEKIAKALLGLEVGL